MAPDWEDLDEFFDPAEFATTGRIWRGGSDLGTISGIFDNPTDRKLVGDYTLDETGPRFLCKETDGLRAFRGDVLEVNGAFYDVIENPTRDGTGLVVLELAEQTQLAGMQEGATYFSSSGGQIVVDETGDPIEDG